MHWTLATSFNFVLHFLESSFKQDEDSRSSSSSSSHGFFDNNGPNQPDDDKKQKLDAAYKFMELTTPVTLEELKKSYKKLSLRYHPDRNGGSKESQNQMQILNACMDLIERDLAGVSDEDEENDDNEHRQDDGKEDQEDPREKYMRMRREMQEEMEKEMKRQQEMKDNFEACKEKDSVECTKKSKLLRLDTLDGRQEANEAFARQVRQTQNQKARESSATEKSKANNMDDIDDHHEEKPPTAPSEETKNKTNAKPRYEIMDCNSNDFAVALRMGMPDIAINLLQDQIQKFFQEASINMHFEEKKKSSQQLRLEWLQQPLDMDNNTILHYAIYYESFQTMKTIFQVSAKDGHIDAVILQPNLHGQSPLFFAEIVKDPSILALIKSQLHLSDLFKQRTQLIPALKLAGKRFFAIFRHLSLVTTLSTALAYYIAHVVFDMHVMTSVVGLVIMRYLGRSTSRVTSLLAFCGMWKLAGITIALIFQFVTFELVLIMLPVLVAGIVSTSASKKRGGLMGMMFLPLVVHAGVCQRLDTLISCQKYVTPGVITKRGWDQLYSFSLVILICLGFNRLKEEI